MSRQTNFSTRGSLLLKQTRATDLPLERIQLRRRANARNVSFRISLRWPIHIVTAPLIKPTYRDKSLFPSL